MDFSFYGPRDASQNWIEECTKTFCDMEFVAGIVAPCNFVHHEKELCVFVHGDDFAIVGPAKKVEWMKKGLARVFEIKAKFFGPAEEGFQSELSLLNRIVRWIAYGLEYEADHRRAELII